jgi:Domain of unknown function (DUF4394)
MRYIRTPLVGTMAFLGWVSFAPSAGAQAVGQPILGLVQNTNSLVRFTTAAPASVGTPVAVTGLAAGDTLKAIDYRPANGMLYGIATDVTNTNVRTYIINPTSGAATVVGVPVVLPVPAMAWDINFNPTVDRIRVVNDQDENARLHPDFGTLAADDTNLNPGTVSVDGVAYTNPFAGATSTTLYALNAATNSLATIGGVNGTPSPNGGLVTDIGPLGITFAGSTAAFDIATNNAAYAVLRPAAGMLTLYTVNLTTGAATSAGVVGDGSLAIDDIAVVDPGLTVSPPTGTYTTRQNFDIVLLTDLQGRNLVSGTITFNGLDVTGVIASCVRVGTTATGVVSLRCPNIGGPVTGAGTHTFVVRLNLNDGTLVQRTVTWNVVAVTEP